MDLDLDQPPPKPPKMALWKSATIAVLSLAVITAVVWLIAAGPAKGRKAFQRPQPPVNARAFIDGGRPLNDPAIATMLRGPFTKFVVQLDHDVETEPRPAPWATPDLTAARDALVAAPMMKAHGPEVASAWAAFMSAFGDWRQLPESDAMAAHLTEMARKLSAAFAQAGLGYYVDIDVLGSGNRLRVLSYTYDIERVSFVNAGDHSERVLDLRRLDHLSAQKAYVGMHATDSDAVVLLDQIQAEVATHTLQALGTHGHFRLGDTNWEKMDKVAPPLIAAVDDAVRTELLAALGPDAAAAQRVGDLLAKRQDLFDSWDNDLRDHHMQLATYDTLFLPEGFTHALSRVVAAHQLELCDEIEADLARDDAARIATLVEDISIASVSRHEAQHGVDFRSHFRQPDALEQVIGPLVEGDHDRISAQREQTELSAFLNQIADDPITPKLTRLAENAFDSNRLGDVYCDVALVALQELARDIGVTSPTQLIVRGAIDRTQLARLAMALVKLDGATLRTTAAKTWSRLYGVPFAPLTDATAKSKT